MNKNNKDKPFTKEDFGLALHKYIIPLYEEVKETNRRLYHVEKNQEEMKKDIKGLYKRVDDVEEIQLRMENKLIDDNKLLHDRDDMHDKKLKEHEKRIDRLEKTI